MTHGSLFSGIGGFDLAAQWAGWNNIFQVEIDPWCQRILAKNFPHVTRHTDIRDFDPAPYAGTIDVLSGGFPCQPYSSAGQRKGKDDPRHLWPEMLRVIRAIQPRWVVGENVRGLVNWSRGLVFHEVQTDLESAGYHVQPYILPAASVNAPHERQRVWFIAYRQSQQMGVTRQPLQHGGMGNITNAEGIGQRKQANEINPVANEWETWPQSGGYSEPVTDTGSLNGTLSIQQRRQDQAKNLYFDWMGKKDAPHPNHQRLKELQSPTIPERSGRIGGNYVDIWDEWTTQPPVCRMDDGIPHRVDRLRGLGNAIVPQLAWRIFDTINQYQAPTCHPERSEGTAQNPTQPT